MAQLYQNHSLIVQAIIAKAVIAKSIIAKAIIAHSAAMANKHKKTRKKDTETERSCCN